MPLDEFPPQFSVSRDVPRKNLRFASFFWLTVSSVLISVSSSFASTGVRPFIIPQPKKIHWSEGDFKFDSQISIVAASGTESAARNLQKELKDVWSIQCEVQPLGEQEFKATIVLRLEKSDDENRVARQGYSLRIDGNQIVISAPSVEGVFNGVQTLKQLILEQNTNVLAPGCTIEDSPALGWRGVYLNLRPGVGAPDAMESLKRLIDSFSRLKLNVLFLEIADAIHYDKQAFPKAEKRAFTKAQIQDLVTYANERHMEIIPSFQLLSHCMWILSNPDNVRLLEDPDNRGWHTAWCPMNPEVDRFIEDILSETIDLFRPRYCHIGIDEVNWGPFRECEKCRAKEPAKLLLDSILKLHTFLKAQGVGTMMWHDTLLPPPNKYVTGTTDKTQGWKIVDQLPKDIIIVDWDYEVFDEGSKSRLEYFTGRGFDVVGATFAMPSAIRTFAGGLAANPKALGLITTYWYLVKDWAQPQTISPRVWRAQVLAAQYSWNPDHILDENSNFDAVGFFRSLYYPSKTREENAKWSPVSMTEAFNGKVGRHAKSWPGYGEENVLDRVLTNGLRDPGQIFSVSKDPEAVKAVLLSGGDNDGLESGSVNVSIDRKARRLAFLHTCNVPLHVDAFSDWAKATDMPQVGAYRINYEDGSSEEVELHYQWNIVDWNKPVGVLEGRMAFIGKTDAGSVVQVGRMDWENPHPDKTIQSITVSSASNDGMSLALFAISTLE